MALVKAETPSEPPNGRQQGTLFYRVGGRNIARSRIKGTTNAGEVQQLRKNALAYGGQTWAYVLNALQQEPWSAFSKFDGRGQLEFSQTSIAAPLAGEPRPIDRTFDAGPSAPVLLALTYQQSPFLLAATISSPGPPGMFTRNWFATPLRTTRSPIAKDSRFILGAAAISGSQNLRPAYIQKFGNPEATETAIRLELYHYANAVPAEGPRTQITALPQNLTHRGRVEIEGTTLQPLGTTTAKLTPQFTGEPVGADVTLQVTAPDWTTTFPSTIPNANTTTATITDTLGLTREQTITFTFTSLAGDVVSLRASPRITI